MHYRKRRKTLLWLLGIACVLLCVYCVRYLHTYYVLEKLKANLRPGEYVVFLEEFNIGTFLQQNQPALDPALQPGEPVNNVSVNLIGRQLPDTRHHLCRSFQDADGGLPSTTVVMVYRNERRSLLLRALYSVLLKSPPNLLDQVILIDDNSDDASTGKQLSAIPRVKVIRNEKQEGLVRSYNLAVSYVRTPVVTFVPCQCEVNVGWLQPLLYRVSLLPQAVVSPVLDLINPATLGYTGAQVWRKGGFDWSLNFRWDELNVNPYPNAVIRSPIYPGAVVTIKKDRFITLGRFDPGFEMAGAENIELSFKAWLCGGVVEIVPCSRVGQLHLPDQKQGLPIGGDNIYLKNVRRVAEVWMDDYKRFFYYTKPSSRMLNVGSLFERKSLRNHLRCRSFKWYLENVYPELRLPVTDEVLFGNIRQADKCIDIQIGHVPAVSKLVTCDPDKSTQDWSLKKSGEITNGGMCLTADEVDTHGYVMVHFCTKDNKSQKWRNLNGQLHRDGTSQCLDSHKAEIGLVLSQCDALFPSQNWRFAAKTAEIRGKDEV